MTKLFIEYDRQYCGDKVIASKVREATDADIAAARDATPCDHSLIYDVPGYLYDIRYCAVCDDIIGFI